MKFVSFLLLICTTLAYGQGSVHVMRSAEPREEVQEVVPVDEDEELLNELDEQRRSRAEQFEQIGAIVPGEDGEVFDPMAELKKLGHDKIDLNTFLDAKVIPIFTRMLQESNIRNIPKEDVRKTVFESFKGQPLEKVFEHCPRCLDIFVDVIRDEKAMPSLLQIFHRKPDLKKFGLIWLGVLIAVFFLKRKIFPKTMPFYKKIPASILMSLFFTVVSFFIFYQMFKAETEPTLRIVLGHF